MSREAAVRLVASLSDASIDSADLLKMSGTDQPSRREGRECSVTRVTPSP
jgi:hypothetical protein